MKLYLLKPVADLPQPGPGKTSVDGNPWSPWFDKAFGFVVRAETEQEARNLAHGAAGDENRHGSPWLEPKFSTCAELIPEGEIGIVVRDFAAA